MFPNKYLTDADLSKRVKKAAMSFIIRLEVPPHTIDADWLESTSTRRLIV